MKKSVKPTGVFVPLSKTEISRLEELVKRRGESVESWLLMVVLGSLESEEFDVAMDRESVAAIHTGEEADMEAEASWEMEDRFFRPLTPCLVARQLTELKSRWYAREDRQFDLEDEFEIWMLSVLIDSIESGGLTLKNPKPALN
jgi:hypothetical protein